MVVGEFGEGQAADGGLEKKLWEQTNKSPMCAAQARDDGKQNRRGWASTGSTARYIYTWVRTSETRSKGSRVPEYPHALIVRRESSRMCGMTRRQAGQPRARQVTYSIARGQERIRNVDARWPDMACPSSRILGAVDPSTSLGADMKREPGPYAARGAVPSRGPARGLYHTTRM